MDYTGDEHNSFDADYPARQKAIRIMEWIADYLGKPDMFDCDEDSEDDTTWYDVEDALTDIIDE